MNLYEFYRKNGSDYNAVLHRFCDDEALVLRFVSAFPKDPIFQSLSEAVSTGNYLEMDAQAHTLKGMSGNLGFDQLYSASADMVFNIRQQNYDAALKSYEKVRQTYLNIIEDIEILNQEHDCEQRRRSESPH